MIRSGEKNNKVREETLAISVSFSDKDLKVCTSITSGSPWLHMLRMLYLTLPGIIHVRLKAISLIANWKAYIQVTSDPSKYLPGKA